MLRWLKVEFAENSMAFSQIDRDLALALRYALLQGEYLGVLSEKGS